MIAFFYYHVSWLLYVLKPSWSSDLNADFEDHAEHEYMEFVRDHVNLESEPFESDFAVAERHHKEESLKRIEKARFA